MFEELLKKIEYSDLEEYFIFNFSEMFMTKLINCTFNKLSKTERELGGIPNSSEDVKQAHASAIESYIEKHIGLDMEGTYRQQDDMGVMPFQRTLEDWAKFDISNRTKFDAAISSGLAVMANQKHLYTPTKEKSKISINFARYNNKNSVSQLLNR